MFKGLQTYDSEEEEFDDSPIRIQSQSDEEHEQPKSAFQFDLIEPPTTTLYNHTGLDLQEIVELLKSLIEGAIDIGSDGVRFVEAGLAMTRMCEDNPNVKSVLTANGLKLRSFCEMFPQHFRYLVQSGAQRVSLAYNSDYEEYSAEEDSQTEDETDDDGADDDGADDDDDTADLDSLVPRMQSIIQNSNGDLVFSRSMLEMYDQTDAKRILGAHGLQANHFVKMYPKRFLHCHQVPIDGSTSKQDRILDVDMAIAALAQTLKTLLSETHNTKPKASFFVSKCRERYPYYKHLLDHLKLKWTDFVKKHVPSLVFSGDGSDTHKFLSEKFSAAPKWKHVDDFLLFLFGKYKRREWPATRHEFNTERNNFALQCPTKGVPSSSEMLYYLRTTAKLIEWVTSDGRIKWVHNVKQTCKAKAASNNTTTTSLRTASPQSAEIIITTPIVPQSPLRSCPPTNNPQPSLVPTVLNPWKTTPPPNIPNPNPTITNPNSTITNINSTPPKPPPGPRSEPPQIKYQYITTAQGLTQVVADLDFPTVHGGPQVVALDCEGVPEKVNLIQLATKNNIWVIDCDSIGLNTVTTHLRDYLSTTQITKVVHDVHQDAWALANLGNITLKGVVDSQLAYEHLFGSLHVGFNSMLKNLGCAQTHESKDLMKRRMQADPNLWSRRPLDRDVLAYAAQDVALLLSAYNEKLRDLLRQDWDVVAKASELRVVNAIRHEGQRSVCFDINNNHRMCSAELFWQMYPNCLLPPVPKLDNSEVKQLFELLPTRYQIKMSGHESQIAKLSDIVLDKNRCPMAFIDGRRETLCDDDCVVTEEDLAQIISNIGGDDHFGGDNRAGINGYLHRISAMRNREKEIYGLTMRAGRHVSGIAEIINDILHEHSDKSVLILGDPGSGKTTIIRDIARTLADAQNVCIVDTSNEIAGDGDVPHKCVGFARRMMVPSLDSQGSVMIECVQNHTPHVIIIDEIGRESEVRAAQTVKNRGVRMIASAHGDFRKLMKNRQLRNLVGEITSTIKPGGKAARERTSEPIFDIVVEVRRNNNTEWNVILDAGKAVDNVIEGQKINCQRRSLDSETKAILIELTQC